MATRVMAIDQNIEKRNSKQIRNSNIKFQNVNPFSFSAT
jgi:hypothetical protein